MDDKFTWDEYITYRCIVGDYSVLEVWKAYDIWYWNYVTNIEHKTDYTCPVTYFTLQEAKDAALLWYLEYTSPIYFDAPIGMAVKGGVILYSNLSVNLDATQPDNNIKITSQTLQDILDKIKALNLPNRYVEIFEYNGSGTAICHIRKLEDRETLCKVRPQNSHSSFYLNQNVIICDECVNKFKERKKK